MDSVPVGVHIKAASVGARARAKQMLECVQDELTRLRKSGVDGGFEGAPLTQWAEQVRNWTPEAVRKLGTGVAVLPRRWVVERTLAWLQKARQLRQDFERLCETVARCIHVPVIRLISNRLAPA